LLDDVDAEGVEDLALQLELSWEDFVALLLDVELTCTFVIAAF
jgi:hypothetical protein